MIIGVDFDGTCVTHEYPEIGKSIGAEKVLKKLVERGHQLVLCTMRGHELYKCTPRVRGRDLLKEAVDWFKDNEIELYGVNKSPGQHTWTDSPKPYANLYIDDAALGCPKVTTEDGAIVVDWEQVEAMLKAYGIL